MGGAVVADETVAIEGKGILGLLYTVIEAAGDDGIRYSAVVAGDALLDDVLKTMMVQQL